MGTEDLSTVLADCVTDVVAEPDPYGRLLDRRHRRTRRRLAVSAAVAALLAVAAVGAPRLVGREPAAPTQPGPATWQDRLLGSPPVGPLASDGRYLAALRAAVTARPTEGLRTVPSNERTILVLFAGDVGRLRVALVAYRGAADSTLVWLVGPAGAGADALAHQPAVILDLPRDPVAVLHYLGGPQTPPGGQALVAVAPTGCAIDTSTDTAHAQWTPGRSYVASTQARTSQWWRVRCEGSVHFEGPPMPDGALVLPSPATLTDDQVQAAQAGARGQVDPAAARAALRLLDQATDAPPAVGPARILWGGTAPNPVRGEQPIAVAAVPVEGGHWLVALAHAPGGADIPQNEDSTSGTRASLNDPQAVYALALPDRPDGTTRSLVVLTPPGAVTAVASGPTGGVLDQQPIHGGVAMLTVTITDPVAVRVLTATGTVQGTYVVGDPTDGFAQPRINSW